MPRLGKLALGFALVVFLGALSICIGYEAAEIASGIVWNPRPGWVPNTRLNYGWPFVVKVSWTGYVGPPLYYQSGVTYYPQGFVRNMAFYGMLAFLELNAVACIGVLHHRNKNKKKQGYTKATTNHTEKGVFCGTQKCPDT